MRSERLPEIIIGKSNVKYELFIPTLTKLFRNDYHQMSVATRIRFSIQVLYKEIIYYAMVDQHEIGYIILQNGGGIRYPDTGSSDRILSPYLIYPQYRHKGYGTILLDDLKNVIAPVLSIERIVAYVKKENNPSIRALIKNGWEFKCYAREKGILKVFHSNTSNGEYLVYTTNINRSI